MNSDPLEIALREVTETKHLLEVLVTSSESFDYIKAKAVLEELRLKVRTLGRIQAELTQCRTEVSNRVIPFPGLRSQSL